MPVKIASLKRPSCNSKFKWARITAVIDSIPGSDALDAQILDGVIKALNQSKSERL